MQQDLGSGSGDEEKITAVGVQAKYSLHASSSSTNESHDDERKKNELFHIRVVSKHTKIDSLFDSGSQVNLIFETFVKKMGLETKPHPKPYPLVKILCNCKEYSYPLLWTKQKIKYIY
jgi:hypothetical protein